MSWYKKLTGQTVDDSLISKKDDEITLKDLLEGNVSKENAHTAEYLKNLAKATGLSIEVVWEMFLTDKKHEFDENYQMLKKFINYSQNEWDKAVKDPTIHDNDKISTIVVSYDYGGVHYTVAYVINETTGELIEQPTNSVFSGLIGYFGGEHAGGIPEDFPKEDMPEPVPFREYIVDASGNLGTGAEVYSSLDIGSRDTVSGKEYLEEKEEQRKREKLEEEIRRQQMVNPSRNGASAEDFGG